MGPVVGWTFAIFKNPTTVKAEFIWSMGGGAKVYIADNLYLYILNTKDSTQQRFVKWLFNNH